jgi:molybdopterin synthase catalytic subunit
MGDLRTGIVAGPLGPGELLPLALPGAIHGALASFVGVVRNEHHGKAVSHLIYDCHAAMASSMLVDLALEARAAHGADLAIALHHGTGRMEIGQAAVAIHVAAAHRDAAFAACRLLIERIKQDLPVWKQEFYRDGTAQWLPGS